MTFQAFDPVGSSAPPPGSPHGQAQGNPAASQDDRTWGAVAHGGSFVAAWLALGVLAPIAVLVGKAGGTPFVRHHAYESLNFQLNTYLWIGIVSVFGIITLGLGWLAFVPLAVWYAIFVIMGTAAANHGAWYRYPLIIRFFRP